MNVLCGREGASKVGDRIMRQPAGGYAVSEYLATILLCPVRGIQSTAPLDAPKYFQHRRCGDLGNRIAADPRKYIARPPIATCGQVRCFS